MLLFCPTGQKLLSWRDECRRPIWRRSNQFWAVFFWNPGSLDRIADILAPEDFYHEAHEKIYLTMLDLYRRREPVDLVTVTALMSDRKILDAVGGPGFLASLTDNVGSAANIEYWGNIVHEKSILRRLITCSNTIAAECYEPISDVENFLDEAENRIFTIAESKMRQGFFTLNTLVEKEISLLEALYGRQEVTTGVATHFRDLDRYTAGLQNSDLIILAARPSMGKTALALNIAYNVAHYSQMPVAVFSLEMSKEQLVRRLLSAIGRIDASRLRRAFLTSDQWTSLQEAAGQLMDCPILIDDTPAVTALEVRAKCRRLKRDKKLGLVLIDYLQLMRGRSDVVQPGAGDLGNFPLPESPGQRTAGPGDRPVSAQSPGGRTTGQKAHIVGFAGIRGH